MELENHGIEIKDWELLTKRDDARTLAYKIIVSLADRTKLEDENVWPEGTTIRPYVQQKRETKGGGRGSIGNKQLWEPGNARNLNRSKTNNDIRTAPPGQQVSRNDRYGFSNHAIQENSPYFLVDVPTNSIVRPREYTPLYSQIVQNKPQQHVKRVQWQDMISSPKAMFIRMTSIQSVECNIR